MPPEVPGTANRFFYRQELMQSTVVDASPIIAIVGRCSVLDFRDYTLSKNLIGLLSISQRLILQC